MNNETKLIGKNGTNLIWKCNKGFYHCDRVYSFTNGCLGCVHLSGDFYFDYVNPDELKEMTDEEVNELLKKK